MKQCDDEDDNGADTNLNNSGSDTPRKAQLNSRLNWTEPLEPSTRWPHDSGYGHSTDEHDKDRHAYGTG